MEREERMDRRPNWCGASIRRRKERTQNSTSKKHSHTLALAHCVLSSSLSSHSLLALFSCSLSFLARTLRTDKTRAKDIKWSEMHAELIGKPWHAP